MVKVKILKSFAWYEKGAVVETVDDHVTRILEKLGVLEILSEGGNGEKQRT